MIKAIIFDLDGTLIEGAEDLQAAANLLLEEAGLAPIDIETVKTFIGDGIGALVGRCFAHRGAESDAASVARFKQIYAAQGYARTRAFPGVHVALETLSSIFVLGLCTNKDGDATRAILDHLGLTRFFTAVIAGDTLKVKKPDPAMLYAAATACGADLTQIVFVGDSEVDAEMCRRAQATFVLFELGYRQSTNAALTPAAVFSDYAALGDVVAALAL